MTSADLEVLHITSLGEHYAATAVVLGRAALPIFEGGREEKSVIDARIGDTAVSFIERPLHPDSQETWRAFREAGIPTPDMFIADNGKLLAGNVRADGSEVYGKYLASAIKLGLPRTDPRPDTDAFFVDLLHPRNTRVQKKVNKYVGTAADASLQLAFDDPFELIVHPDGDWDLIALDLTHAESTPKTDTYALRVLNSSATAAFEAHLDTIRAGLVSQGVQPRSPHRRAKFLPRLWR
jgi:hypothetical protein